MKRAGRGVSEGNHGDKTLIHRCDNMKTKVSLSTRSPAQPERESTQGSVYST